MTDLLSDIASYSNKNEALPSLPTEKEYKAYQSLIYNKLGINLTTQKRAMLGHRLYKRLLARDCQDFGQYYHLIMLPKNNKEQELALELITTNETFFFREFQHFQHLQDSILNDWPRESLFRVWSAACSTGEEAYSLAMTLQKQLTSAWQITATDVNRSVLKKAQKAIYLDQRTEHIPKHFRHEFCRRGVDEFSGYMRVIPKLRNKINFTQFNLLNDMSELGSFDLIVIRNVLIYFDEQTKRKIIANIAKQLSPKGWLYVGHSESLFGISDEFTLIQPAVYRKKE